MDAIADQWVGRSLANQGSTVAVPTRLDVVDADDDLGGQQLDGRSQSVPHDHRFKQFRREGDC